MTDDTEPTSTTDEQHEDTLPPSVREGLRDATTPLTTTDRATDPEADGLAAVCDRLADAAVVGLGEATHGTHEFFELKRRVLRHLVVEHGVRAVAVESGFPETMALHDYVVHGEGDPRDALAALSTWVWQVQSVLGTVEWLRAFNAGRPMDDRVRVYGVGAHVTRGAVERLRDYLATADSEFLDEVREDLAAVDDEGVPPAAVEGVSERVAAAERLVPTLRERFDERRAAHVAAASERAWAHARRSVAVIDQVVGAAEAFDAYDGDLPTDDDPPAHLLGLPGRSMADTVAWVRDRTDAEPLVLWAHDAHCNRVAYPHQGFVAAAPSLGRHLADRHGDDYYALGFSFARGGFGAARANRDDESGPREVVLDGPLPDTIDAALGALEEPLAFLNVRAARDDERTADWLAEPRAQFRAPGTVDPEALDEELVEHVYGDAFDGLCFVRETTRARPLGDHADEDDATG